jgi:hypothetical protein
VWSEAKRIAILLVAAAALCVAGCGPAVKAERAAAPEDLQCAIEAVGLQPEGGMPESLRLTVVNRSGQAIDFMPPRPLAILSGEPPPGEEMPFPVLGLFMKDAAGHEESPVYTSPRAKSWPKPKTEALAPGGKWSAEYPLAQFYFWGPCGPDTGGPFIKYFWRGEEAVSLSAALIFGKDRMVRSPPITVRCKHEPWLFKK